MTLVELTEMIVKSLVSDPDSISVKEFSNDDEIIIEVVVQASSYLKDNKRVKINISSF